MTTRERLAAIAENLWWSWNPEAISLFARLNPDVFRATRNNPIAALQTANPDMFSDTLFAAEVERVYDLFDAYMSAPTEFGPERQTAYFCMEYGLHESLPLYAGGLGILAGDHTKAASDVGFPFVAVGLFLKGGYFRQYFDKHGHQQAAYPSINVTKHPFRPVLDSNGEDIHVTVMLGETRLTLSAWQVKVGRSILYVLDADTHHNPFELRFLTSRLYAGDRKTRIRQEIILGIGGVRLLRRLGINPTMFHVNEGHCAFLTFELLRERLQQQDLESAETFVREHTVFTTHTPVMAGHDRFTPELFAREMSGYSDEIGLDTNKLLSYGRIDPNDTEESFTMTVLGLNLSGKVNGVSRLNGEVARAQWRHKYPQLDVDDVPIGHVTNGIHLPTWTSPIAVGFLRRHLGDWVNSPQAWNNIFSVSDEDLWEYRRRLRTALVEFIDRHTRKQTLPQLPLLDPEALIVGFARRFATYKRAPLLFHDVERAMRLFSRPDQRFQIVFAGKSHPADAAGKDFIKRIYDLSQTEPFRGKVVILEDYNMEVGRMLTSGADIWLNNPRRPYEASGTSGQKVVAHGGLNLSILDGWWPEGYNGENGWAIGDNASATYEDPEIQDPKDAAELYAVLENEVIPTFYDRDESGLPVKWIRRVRNAMSTLPYQFSARRMILDYINRHYTVGVGLRPTQEPALEVMKG